MQTAKITAFVFGLALVSSACGDSMSALNPTAPSSLSPDAVNIEAGANGVAGAMGNGPKPGNGNGNGNGGGQTPSSTTGPIETRVQFEGTIDAKGDNSLTVGSQVVKVTSQTVIRKGDLRYDFSALVKGDRVHVDAMRSDDNGVVSVEAREIKLQNPGEGGETVPPPPPPAGSLSVVAVDAAAEEGPANTGTFRVTRSGDAALLALPLTVSFTLGGTATHGSDYNASTSVSFDGGVLNADVVVTALADNVTEGSEAVTLTLSAVAPYTVGANASATVTITDPPAPPAPAVPAVSVRADSNSISTEGSVGAFFFTRSGDLSQPLTITFSVSGTAGSAYAHWLGTSLTFPANDGEEFVSFLAMPGDAVGTVIVTVLDGAAYNPGTQPSATITITP